MDASSGTLSAAVLAEGEVRSMLGSLPGGAGSEQILTLAQRAVEMAGVVPGELDAVAVTRGPGKLTGLRVGIGAARGIATGLGGRLIGVSTLQVVAASVHAEIPVLALIDAGRGDVYGCLYRPGLPPRGLGPERVATARDFAEAVAGRRVRVAGNGGSRYHGLFGQAAWQPSAHEAFLAPAAGRVAAAIMAAEKGGGHPSPPTDELGKRPTGRDPATDPSPVYLRRAAEPVRFQE